MTPDVESELGGPRITRIDGLRAIAVLLVFSFHTGFVADGWIGVHMFFVLSGFLITSILRRTRAERHFWAPFYIKRAARILPPLVIIFAAAAIIYHLYPWHGVALLDLLFLGNVAQTLHPSADANLGVLWSLAVEEHFYLLWPFAIRFLERKTIMRILVAVILIEPLLRALATPYIHTYVPVYNLTPFQLDGLAAGSLLALLVENKSVHPLLRRSSGWCALSAVLALQLLYRLPGFTRDANTMAFNSLGYTLILFFSVSFLAFVLLRPDALVVRLVNHPWVVFIGGISYGMYLFNPLALMFSIRLFHEHGLRHDKAAAPLALALTILIAWLSFRFYETPIIRIGRARARSLAGTSGPLPPSPIVQP
jgi:peptidoglycan/LPS O-acetylase OafA/YrhL